MFTTRKTLEIEYNPTSEEKERLSIVADSLRVLYDMLYHEGEKAVYFNENEYSIESIKNVVEFLDDMSADYYNPNILGQ